MTPEQKFDLWETLNDISEETSTLKMLYDCKPLYLMWDLAEELDELGFLDWDDDDK